MGRRTRLSNMRDGIYLFFPFTVEQRSIAEFYYNEIIISAAMEPAQFFSFTDVPEGFF